MQARGSPLEPLEQGVVLTRWDKLGRQDHGGGLARQIQGHRQGPGARAHERHLGAGTHAPKPYGGVMPAAEWLELAILGVLYIVPPEADRPDSCLSAVDRYSVTQSMRPLPRLFR